MSLKRDLPEAWKRLRDASDGAEVIVELPLDLASLAGRYRGLDVRIERVTAFAHARSGFKTDALRMRLEPPKGSGTAVTGFIPPWPGSFTLRATSELTGAPGAWKLALAVQGTKAPSAFDDIVLVFELRARRL